MRRAFRLLLAFFAVLSSSLAADTFILRPSATSKQTARALASSAAIGERYCNDDRCIVLAETPAQKAALQTLEQAGSIVTPFPEARKVNLAGATWDADSQAFDRPFPGSAEVTAGGESVFAVIFKSFPEEEWLQRLTDAGFILTEPLPTMAYLVYGDRQKLQAYALKASHVLNIVEVPPGLRRIGVDENTAIADSVVSTLVTIVNVSASQVAARLKTLQGAEPAVASGGHRIVAHQVPMSRADAVLLSRFPEVVSVFRMTAVAQPSDERSNRIVAGTLRAPGTSWPTTLGANPQPGQFYWSDYISQLPSHISGFDPFHQTIAAIDTGLDVGTVGPCPAYFLDGAGCHFAFGGDLTTGFYDPQRRAEDGAGHGTMTSSLMAGFVDTPAGRDAPAATGNYAFTQGVAQGTRVAVTKFFSQNCDAPFRTAGGGAEQGFSNNDAQERARYAIVTMNTPNRLPAIDYPGSPNGPGAAIFNHSWNIYGLNPPYESVSQLLDQTTRTPTAAQFDFGTTTSHNVFNGTGDPILHVVSAGNNVIGPTTLPPALAKNVLAVGATQTYNQQPYDSGTGSCPQFNDAGHAADTSQIAPFSCISPDPGPGNFRYKPELVAPGIRTYGPRSPRYNGTFYCVLCNADLAGNLRYVWDAGTSFAAPVVSGAAALVREWLARLNDNGGFSRPFTSPSPALVKATLIAGARFLTGTNGPDRSQGFGGVALDPLFRDPTHYFFADQQFRLPNQGNYRWEQTLTINPGADVSVALVWTDRASLIGPGGLANDLDLRVQATIAGTTHTWYGNNFTNRYSAKDLANPTFDTVNTAEKIIIPASDLVGTTQITIRVTASGITGDGIDPNGLILRQDFALAAINAH